MSDEPAASEDRPSKSPRRGWSGWQWTALLLTLLMVCAVGGTAAYVIADTSSGPPAANTPPPSVTWPGPALDLGGPHDDRPWVEPLDEDRDEVKRVFAQFGAAVRDPRNDLFGFFDPSEVRASDTEDVLPGLDEDADGRPLDPDRFAQAVVRRERAVWAGWDWDQTDVRRVMRHRAAERFEAVVWHRAKAGGRAKVRWTLVRLPDGLRVVGWEDLTTGLTAADLVSAQTLGATGRTVRVRGQSALPDMRTVHRHLDADNPDAAYKALQSLQRVQFRPGLRYAVDLAEARYWLHADEPEATAELCDDLIQKDRPRLAAYLLGAEAALAAEDYEKVKELCAAFTAVTGDDPDALALRAEANYRLVETDEAKADYERALALDPYQPLAVDWVRRGLPAERKKEVADLLARAPQPERLFDTLARRAAADEDWQGLAALGERFRTLRPADPRGPSQVVVARCRLKQTAEATALFKQAVGKLAGDKREEFVTAYTAAMVEAERPLDAYAAVSAADAPAVFRAAGDHLWNQSQPWGYSREADRDMKRKAAEGMLRELIADHKKKCPADTWGGFFTGQLHARAEEYEPAEKAFASAAAGVSYTGDPDKDWKSGYNRLRFERVRVLHKLGRGVDAYRALKPSDSVFAQLTELYTRDKDADGLAELLDAREKAEPTAEDAAFWRGEVNWLRKKYADALPDYRKHVAAAGAQPYVAWNGRDRLIRCLLRVGQADEAKAELGQWLDAPTALRAAVFAATGDAATAEQVMREQLAQLPHLGHMFYADEDLGPLLKTSPAFDQFRTDHSPPPAGKANPDG